MPYLRWTASPAKNVSPGRARIPPKDTPATVAELGHRTGAMHNAGYELPRTPLWRSSHCPIAPVRRAYHRRVIIHPRGIIRLLCTLVYEPPILYIRRPVA